MTKEKKNKKTGTGLNPVQKDVMQPYAGNLIEVLVVLTKSKESGRYRVIGEVVCGLVGESSQRLYEIIDLLKKHEMIDHSFIRVSMDVINKIRSLTIDEMHELERVQPD